MDEGELQDRGVLVHFLVLLGGALVLSGEAVDIARNVLLKVAERNDADDIDIIVLPTVLLIQAGRSHGAKVQLSSVSSKRLRLDQVSEVYELAAHSHHRDIGAGLSVGLMLACTIFRPRDSGRYPSAPTFCTIRI